MGAVLSVGPLQTQAIYHFLRTLRSYAAKYSFATPIVLWDGVPWRKTFHPGYKASRDIAETPAQKKQAEMKRAYGTQRPYIQKALGFLGVTQVQASNMEADDLAAIMADLYASQGALVTLLSEDQDWFQIIQEGVAQERPIAGDRVTLANFEEKTGVPSPSDFVMVKAFSGDSGDDISPVGGIGKKRALDLIREHGTLDALLQKVMIDKIVDPATLPKYLKDLVENEEKAIAYAFNMSMVDLRWTGRPAVEGLVVNPGEPSEENFRQMCELLLFKTFTDDFHAFTEAFPVGRSRFLAQAA